MLLFTVDRTKTHEQLRESGQFIRESFIWGGGAGERVSWPLLIGSEGKRGKEWGQVSCDCFGSLVLCLSHSSFYDSSLPCTPLGEWRSGKVSVASFLLMPSRHINLRDLLHEFLFSCLRTISRMVKIYQASVWIPLELTADILSYSHWKLSPTKQVRFPCRIHCPL